MRCLHLARAAILPQVSGFGKNVVPLFRFWLGNGFIVIGSGLVHGLRKNRSLRRSRKFGGGVFHKATFVGESALILFFRTMLLSRTAEAEAIIRFEPVERGGFVGIQPKPVTILNKVSSLLRVFHQAVAFLIIRPVLDFRRRLFRAMVQQPGADLVIILCSFYGGGELVAGDALETEELFVKRTIVVIVAERARQAGAAFVHGPACDGESAEAFTRTVWCLFG